MLTMNEERSASILLSSVKEIMILSFGKKVSQTEALHFSIRFIAFGWDPLIYVS